MGIASLSDDTSPQLGGPLDMNGEYISSGSFLVSKIMVLHKIQVLRLRYNRNCGEGRQCHYSQN